MSALILRLTLLLCLGPAARAGGETWHPELPPWAKIRPAPQVLLILDDRAAMADIPAAAEHSPWDLARRSLLALVDRYAPLGVRFGLMRSAAEEASWPPPDLILAPLDGSLAELRRALSSWTHPLNPPPSTHGQRLDINGCADLHLIFSGPAEHLPAQLRDWLRQRLAGQNGEPGAPRLHLLSVGDDPAEPQAPGEDPLELFFRFDAILADFLHPWVSGTIPTILTRDDQSEVLLQTGFAPLSGRGDLAAYVLPLSDEGEGPIPALWSAARLLEAAAPEQRRLITTAPEAAGLDALRKRPLGAIIHAAPLVIGAPRAGHLDAAYQSFRRRWQKRPTRIYVAANDGLLHALRAAGEGDAPAGSEAWAFVPAALPRTLAQAPNAAHPYLLDLAPVAADAEDPAWGRGVEGWRTVLVGGAGLGGPGYFALDVTDPAAPAPLWEVEPFAGARTGTRPILGPLPPLKRWAALVTSGLRDDDHPGGLRALALSDGSSLPLGAAGETLLETASRPGAGTTYALSEPVALDTDGDGALDLLYAGDSEGTLWKFFYDADAGHWRSRPRFHTGGPPIVHRPTLAFDGRGDLRIYFGTGRYLKEADHADGRGNAVYGLIEPRRGGGAHPFAAPEERTRSAEDLVEVTDFADEAAIDRSLESARRALLEKNGWYIRLQSDGSRPAERLAGVPLVVAGTLFFPTLMPSAAPCSLGAEARLHALRHDLGVPARQGSRKVLRDSGGDELSCGPGAVRLPDGAPAGLRWIFARRGRPAGLFASTSTAPLHFVQPELAAPALSLRAWREVD
ncbi:pilus assembly protein [Geoalkalibacter sp.]|uniref:pilus assembly protein n=1 Tax=Geoalkalibacter sp. TaxID=3041440 RepID=UPI00272E5553|nr:PilC/PilY family type IV pilus protein [Geoalkalibacter sp.]